MSSRCTFVIIVAILGLVVTSPFHSDKDYETYHCVMNERYYEVGTTFTLEDTPCTTYRCDSHKISIIQDGCYAWGQCRPKGETFQYKCVNYVCHVFKLADGYKRYEVNYDSQHQCEDAYGHCRFIGETFDYVMNGFMKHNCVCEPQSNHVRYKCPIKVE